MASEFEKVLGIIKNNSKGLLEKEGILSATNQLMLLEVRHNNSFIYEDGERSCKINS